MIATKILPNLVGNLADLNLSKSEFKSYLTTIQALLKKIEEERLSDGSAPAKEEESDMNKILKEIEDMDKDATKKNSDIFSAMQGPSTGNDFDFLSLFDGGAAPINVTPKNESFSSNDITISNSGMGTLSQPQQQQPIKEFSSGIQITSNKPQPQETVKQGMGQKVEENFDFFNEIENSNKAFSSAPKPKPQNSGLFNQTVQMKKTQNLSSNSGMNPPTENVNQGNLFSNLNVNQKASSQSMNLNNPSIVQTKQNNNMGMNMGTNLNFNNNNNNNNNNAKGNMLNMNYDPFSDLDIKPNNNNPFAGDSMGMGNLGKPSQGQPPQKSDGGGWNFDDLNSIKNPPSKINFVD